jgi:hypothetical protein
MYHGGSKIPISLLIPSSKAEQPRATPYPEALQ